jgi:hypothetical protein
MAANSYIQDLDVCTTPATTDVLAIVTDPSTTPVTKQVTVADLLAGAGGGGSGWVLLEQHTASASASLDFTTAFTSTYDIYMFQLLNLSPTTNGQAIYMKASTDGGSTWLGGTSYSWGWYFVSDSGAAGAVNSTSAAEWNLGTTVANAPAPAGVCGTVTVFDPLAAQIHYGHIDLVYPQASMIAPRGLIRHSGTTAFNAFQFLFASGTIASGTVRCYGMTKS